VSSGGPVLCVLGELVVDLLPVPEAGAGPTAARPERWSASCAWSASRSSPPPHSASGCWAAGASSGPDRCSTTRRSGRSTTRCSSTSSVDSGRSRSPATTATPVTCWVSWAPTGWPSSMPWRCIPTSVAAGSPPGWSSGSPAWPCPSVRGPCRRSRCRATRGRRPGRAFRCAPGLLARPRRAGRRPRAVHTLPAAGL